VRKIIEVGIEKLKGNEGRRGEGRSKPLHSISRLRTKKTRRRRGKSRKGGTLMDRSPTGQEGGREPNRGEKEKEKNRSKIQKDGCYLTFGGRGGKKV